MDKPNLEAIKLQNKENDHVVSNFARNLRLFLKIIRSETSRRILLKIDLIQKNLLTIDFSRMTRKDEKHIILKNNLLKVMGLNQSEEETNKFLDEVNRTICEIPKRPSAETIFSQIKSSLLRFDLVYGNFKKITLERCNDAISMLNSIDSTEKNVDLDFIQKLSIYSRYLNEMSDCCEKNLKTDKELFDAIGEMMLLLETYKIKHPTSLLFRIKRAIAIFRPC